MKKAANTKQFLNDPLSFAFQTRTLCDKFRGILAFLFKNSVYFSFAVIVVEIVQVRRISLSEKPLPCSDGLTLLIVISEICQRQS